MGGQYGSRHASAPIRFAGLALAGLAAATVVTACSGGGSGHSGSKTIVFANFGAAETSTRPGMAALIKEFERENPGVTVKSEPIPLTDIGHTLLLQTQAGNTPDVAQLAGNDTEVVAATKALAPLDDIAPRSWQDSIVPTALKAGRIDGKLDAVPFYDDTSGLWYNRTIMKAARLAPTPPTTAQQLLSDLAAIKAKEPSVIGLGIDTTNRTFGLSVTWPWLTTFGARPFTGGKATADTPAMKSYLTFMRELAVHNYIHPGHKIGDFRPLAAQNKVAFTWDQPLFQSVVQTANNQSDADFYKTWGVAPLPAGPTGKPATIDLGSQLVMFKKAANKPLAWKFMKFLASSEYSMREYCLKYESALPPVKNPPASVAKGLNTPVYRAFSGPIADTTVLPEYGRPFAEAYSAIMAGVQIAVGSSRPVADIASSMQSQLKSALS